MDTKLESILKKINYKNDYFVEFIDAKVDRVNANGSKLDIVIHNKTNLTTEAYNELEKSFKDFFNIEEIYLYIIVDEIDNDKLLNEYKNIIGLLKKEKSLLWAWTWGNNKTINTYFCWASKTWNFSSWY